MRKISLEQATALLNGFGQDVEVVADEKQADKDFNVDEAVNETREAIQAEATVDSSVLEEAGKKATGQLLGTLRSQMAKVFGGTQRDYIGTDDKQLTIQEIVALAKTKFDERTGTQAKEWESERQQLIEEHEAALEKTKTEYETQVNAERNKYIERDISASTLSMLEKIPRKGGDLSDDADTLLYKARQQYEVRYNEEKKIIEFWKDNKPAPVKPEDFAKQWYEKTGRLATDTRHISPKDVKTNNIEPKGVVRTEPTEKQIPQSQESIYDWANQE